MEHILWKDTLPQIVKHWGRIQPDKIAIVSGDKSTTYAKLNEMVNGCCSKLREYEIKPGDYVGISAVMKAEYIAAFLAVKKLRMVAVPISKTASETEVSEIIERIKAPIFFTDNPRYQSIVQCVSLKKNCVPQKGEGILEYGEEEEIPGDEITEVLFTSGTTGKPKGAMLSQKGIAASIYNTATGMDMDNKDVLLLPLPLNHSFGLRVLRSALFRGETVVLQNGFSFAKELEENIIRWNCNCMVAVNAGFEMLKQQMGDRYQAVFSKMRYIEFGAGAVPVRKREQLIKDLPGVRLYNTWGSTETGGGLFLEFSANPDKMKSAGAPINDIQAAIIGEQGEELAAGEYGRLAIKSRALLFGYYDDLELTKSALHGDWLWTNDVARVDKDGYIYLNGRIDDIINVGGEKVSPVDVERILLSQPGVKECACCGVDDPKGILGQVVAAFLVAEDKGYEEKQLEEQIREQGNGFMVPAAYIQLEELPRNYMGKLDREQLKEIWKKTFRQSNSSVGESGYGQLKKTGGKFLRQKDGTGSEKKDFSEKVLELMLSRRSIRAYQERPVEKELLEKLVLAGRMAPSGHNMQTWRFTVLRMQSAVARLKETVEKVASEKKIQCYGFLNPQAMILVSNDRRNPDGIQDSSAAIENILLMAHALGLGACWINALRQISDEPGIRKILNQYGIPETHLVYGMIGLGFPEGMPKTPVKKENVVTFIEE